MRFGPIILVILFSALMVLPGVANGDIADPGSPRYVNSILNGFVTPVVSPGDTVDFSFNVTNPYPGTSVTIVNVTLTVGIYRYSTLDKTENVTSSFPRPPLIEGDATQVTIHMMDMTANLTTRVELPIETTKRTPHGSYFSQSTYFVRFNLSFNFEGNETKVVLISRGFFTEEQWNTAVSTAPDEPLVNRTYLKSIGVDGILPDSSFGIKIKIPRWPLAVLVVGIIGLTIAATCYHVLDNPGRYPKLEQRLYYLRGKLRELRRKPKDG